MPPAERRWGTPASGATLAADAGVVQGQNSTLPRSSCRFESGHPLFRSVQTSRRPIVALHERRIVEHGNQDELVGKHGLYADVFSLQASGYQ